MKDKIYCYIVEGEIEEKIIKEIKNKYINSGTVIVRNPIQKKLKTIIPIIKPKTTIILVFDTDVTTNIKILDENIRELNKAQNVKEIILIPQVKNIEEEIIYSTKIKKIDELLGKDFKINILKCNNLLKKLEDQNFDINLFWSQNQSNIFKKYKNESKKIKMKK